MKRKPAKKDIIRISTMVLILLFLVIGAFISWMPVTERIPLDLFSDGSSEVKIILITDLHSCRYGKNQKSLIRRIEKENPDVILMAGDFFDDKLKDDNAKILAKSLAAEYPCFYATGNHEFWSGRVDEIKDYMRSVGVTVLSGDCESICINGRQLDICGVDDPTRLREKEWRAQLDAAYAKTDENHLKILVTHRPEKTDVYSEYDFDLIVAGHAHAGQIRIPFINRGLYAPNQGFWPKYVSGKYTLSNGSTMVVSRGLARESTPLPRYFNRPEVVLLKIQ